MFIRETHGIHIGTGKDHIKHGIDDVSEIVELAIQKKHPSITFIIHTPRLTGFRYQNETATDIKFIRGDNAYLQYAETINQLREKFSDQIKIFYGIELEYLGTGLGLNWNRAKIFQAGDPDFVIGSVHFSKEGIPYDGSKKEADELLALRGSLENYWDQYLLEIMEMIDSSSKLFQVIGHLDLPKLNQPIPEPLLKLDTSDHFLARRMRTLLELISEYNLTLDVNLAGIKKGCGIYPDINILRRAYSLRIPLTIGSDTHNINDFTSNYTEGINYIQNAGFKHYVYFSKKVPAKTPLSLDKSEEKIYSSINLAIGLLNKRFLKPFGNTIPKLSLGGKYRTILDNFPNATSLGDYNAIRVRKRTKSLTIGYCPKNEPKGDKKLLYSLHYDKPGILSTLLNTLASEEINVNTAILKAGEKDKAEAWLELSGDESQINNAIDFTLGSASDRFCRLEYSNKITPPTFENNSRYLLEIDGVDLPIPVSKKMILSIHKDSPGVLLILLSAIASRGINIINLQLGRRGENGYAIFGIEGDLRNLNNLIPQLGDEYKEISLFDLEDTLEV